MGYPSQEGQIAIITQAAPGVYTPVTNGLAMRHRGGGLGANRDLIIPDPEIGGNRDIPQAVLGPVSFAGDIDFYGRMQGLATLLFAAFGAKDSSGSVGTTEGLDVVGSHILTPPDVALPLLSMQEIVAGGLDNFQYTDAVVNSLSLEAEPDGYLMGTVGKIARIGVTTASPDTPTRVDTTPLMVGTSMVVTIGGSTADIVRNFSMDFNNNFEDDVFELGSIYLADLTPKRRELTTSFTIRPRTVAQGGTGSDLWHEAVFGATAANAPQSGAAFETSVNIAIESYTFVGTDGANSADSTTFKLELDIPFANVKPFNNDPSGDDVIEWDVEIQALRPTAAPLVTATITNDLLTVL